MTGNCFPVLLPWYDLLLQSRGRPDDVQDIRRRSETGLALAQKRDDRLGIAHGLIMVGHFTEPGEAITMYEQALAVLPRLDDSFWVRIRIGFCHRALGERHKEVKAFWQSYERGREIGEREKKGWSLYNLADTEISLGDHLGALTHLREAKMHFGQVGTLSGTIWTNVKLCLMRFAMGDFDEARSLIDEARAVAKDANRSQAIEKESLILRGYLSLVEQDYQKAQNHFEEILVAFSTSPEASLGLTFVACAHEDYPTAGRHMYDSLHSSPFRFRTLAIMRLPAAALLMGVEDDDVRAVELLSLACHRSNGMEDLLKGWPLLKGVLTELETRLSPNAFDAAWARGQALELSETLTLLEDQFQIGAI